MRTRFKNQFNDSTSLSHSPSQSPYEHPFNVSIRHIKLANDSNPQNNVSDRNRITDSKALRVKGWRDMQCDKVWGLGWV
jgi:hypothetical protein